MPKRFRLAVLNSHPIQYFAPLYRQIAATEDIDITAYYCSRQGLERGYVDPGFGHEVVWDVPLLDGYRHVFLRNLWGDRGVGGFFSLANLGIVGELLRNRYDAIWLHGHNYLSNILALCVAKMMGTKVFMRGETHLLLERSGTKRLLRKALMTVFYGLCDACLYIGSRNRDFYQAHGVPDRKLFFVPYAVDNDMFASSSAEWEKRRDRTRADLGIDASIPVILFASKLTERKRPADLLRSFEMLRKTGCVAALICVGDGAERPALQAYAREHAIPDVHFLGFKNQSELPKYYSVSDVFVLPSVNEPWGLIINEVMNAGVPVITTTDVGAAADLVIDGESGFTYAAGAIEDLAALLRKMLENASLRARLASGARARIHGWSYAQCVDGVRAALSANIGARTYT